MVLKFHCEKCGEPILTKFLKIGETAKCKNCGADNKIPPDAESTDDVPDYAKPALDNSAMENEETDPNSPFSNLRLVSALIKFFAWLAGIGYLFFGVYTLSKTGGGNGFIIFLLMIAGAGATFATLWAAGEMILVALSIEKNTRLTREILKNKGDV